jgi:hypothetical protein
VGRRSPELLQFDYQQGQALPDIVMQFSGNAPSFVFLRGQQRQCLFRLTRPEQSPYSRHEYFWIQWLR